MLDHFQSKLAFEKPITIFGFDSEVSIYHKKIMILDFEIHQLTLSNISKNLSIEQLYQRLNIDLPLSIKTSSFIRKLDFLAGRLAAKYALASFDLPDFLIQKGCYGEPIFPNGILGSISHINDGNTFKAIACAFPSEIIDKNIGIDIEAKNNKSFFAENVNIQNIFMSDIEIQRRINVLDKYKYIDLIIFSAKESIIKAFFQKYKKIINIKSIEYCSIENNWIKFKILDFRKIISSSFFPVYFYNHDNEIITISCI